MTTKTSSQLIGVLRHRTLKELLFLVLAFVTAYALSPLVNVAFDNPFNISNPLNSSGFNPDNNFYLIAWMIFGTLLLNQLIARTYATKASGLIKAIVIVAILTNYVFASIVPSPGYLDSQGIVDDFHAGEQLAAANEWLSGRVPYSDTFYLRGFGVDAFIPAIGTKLLGDSIGAFIVTMDAMEVLALASFLLLFACIIRNSLVFSALAILLYLSDSLSLIHFRDIVVWLIFGLVLLLFRSKSTGVYARLTVLFTIGLLTVVQLFIAIDRGVSVLLLAALLGLTLLVFRPASNNNRYYFDPSRWRDNAIAPTSILAGMVTGALIALVWLGSDACVKFFKMTFVEIPAYGGLLVSQPFPMLTSSTYLFWGPICIAISSGYLLIKLWGVNQVKNINVLLPYSLLLLFGIILLKAGANRIALTKLSSVTAPLILISVLIVVYAFSRLVISKKERTMLMVPIALCAVTAFIFAQINVEKALYEFRPTRAQLAAYKILPEGTNDEIVSSKTNNVAKYIKSNTASTDVVFAFTSNPIYYYLSDRRNPTRFNVSWFADPQPYTTEMLNDLREQSPKLVIYQEGTWMDSPDNVAMQERIPEVNDWLLRNYTSRVVVDGVIILKK